MNKIFKRNGTRKKKKNKILKRNGTRKKKMSRNKGLEWEHEAERE